MLNSTFCQFIPRSSINLKSNSFKSTKIINDIDRELQEREVVGSQDKKTISTSEHSDSSTTHDPFSTRSVQLNSSQPHNLRPVPNAQSNPQVRSKPRWPNCTSTQPANWSSLEPYNLLSFPSFVSFPFLSFFFSYFFFLYFLIFLSKLVFD